MATGRKVRGRKGRVIRDLNVWGVEPAKQVLEPFKI